MPLEAQRGVARRCVTAARSGAVEHGCEPRLNFLHLSGHGGLRRARCRQRRPGHGCGQCHLQLLDGQLGGRDGSGRQVQEACHSRPQCLLIEVHRRTDVVDDEVERKVIHVRDAPYFEAPALLLSWTYRSVDSSQAVISSGLEVKTSTLVLIVSIDGPFESSASIQAWIDRSVYRLIRTSSCDAQPGCPAW